MIGASLRALAGLVRARPWDARGRVVVVTGGAGGIGSALARRLAVAGASVVVLDLDARRADEVVAALPPAAAGAPAHLALTADLTDPAQVGAALARVEAHAGRIDVLVNNAGMTSSERFGVRSLESIERELVVNTLSPLYVTRLALDLLRRSSDPRVISTVSLGGIFPLAETPVYCASKFGLRGAMISIALDLAPQGIKVGSVMPSATDTRMLAQEAIEGGNALQFQAPPQQPEDVVRAVVSLLDRPRLEAYPKPSESLLVRAVMAVPNLLPVLVPLFAGRGEAGRAAYLRDLVARGVVVEVDGHLELAP